MRKAMVLAFAMLAVPALASAQGGPPGGGRGMMQQNVAKLLIDKQADLSLTAEQVTKLEAVAKKIDEKTTPIMADLRKARESGAGREVMMGKMQELRGVSDEAFEKDIKPVLSEEQATKAAKIIEESRPMRRGGGDR